MTVKNGSTAKSDFQDIPIATKVEIIGDVESNTGRTANNPDYTPVQTHSSAIATAPASTLAIPATHSVSRKKVHSNLGRRPYGLQCHHCHRETITIVEDRIGIGTIVVTVMLAILFWPLCWLPFCLPSCKQTQHYCGHDSCQKKVGVTHVCA